MSSNQPFNHPPAAWVLLLALLGMVLYLCSKVLIPFLSIILWASVFAIVFRPTHQKVLKRIPESPSLASAYSTALVLFAIILPFIAITLAVGAELQTTLGTAPARLAELVTDPDPRYARQIERATDFLHRRIGVSEEQLREQAQALATRLSSVVIQGTVNVVGGMLEFLVALAMIVFTLFYFFRDGEIMVALAQDWLPLDGMRSRMLLHRVADLIHASVYGIVVLSVIQGSLGGLAFWALGLPNPLLWAVVMSLLSTIPMLGSFVVWIPAALYLAATGVWWKAVALCLWGSLVIGMSDNVLRPVLVGQRAKMHQLMVFFSVLGGVNAFGVLGILMGPVLMALATALLAAFRATDHPDLLAPLNS